MSEWKTKTEICPFCIGGGADIDCMLCAGSGKVEVDYYCDREEDTQEQESEVQERSGEEDSSESPPTWC